MSPLLPSFVSLFSFWLSVILCWSVVFCYLSVMLTAQQFSACYFSPFGVVFVYLYYFVIKTQFPCILSPRHLSPQASWHRTPQLLRRHSCLCPCSSIETIEVGLLQLTQGGSKVKHQRQSTIVGAAFICVTSHRQKAENGLIWKSGYYFCGFLLL